MVINCNKPQRLTRLCSQFHYFASRSLKLTFFLNFALPSTVSCLLVEGGKIMRVVFLHFTYNSGERDTDI